MAKIDTSEYQSFDQITARLDSIVDQVRDKSVSLEHSLDLFDEAIALGSKAVNMVDTTEFTPEEEERLVQAQAAGDASTSEPVVEEQTSSEQVEASTLDKTSSDDSVSESDEH
ncbi:exodeoxyribonuclease VII small subunit [Lancefieldella parvula]|uniref:exodeoxyribonuclease VII small subunit n=1 Tax=Lancefieldella parvula TaxID=1382 RepID=UPI0028D534A6|nr:exodeoxyribonuclease VII small subunit [Lancefieldella parvula]